MTPFEQFAFEASGYRAPDVVTLPPCFALLIALWGLALGEVAWWMWAGLAWYGGLGAWAALAKIGNEPQSRR